MRRSAASKGRFRSPGGNCRFARNRSPRYQMPVVSDRLRTADQIALNFGSLPGKEGPLILGLHALGNDRQCKGAAERQNGVDDRFGLKVSSVHPTNNRSGAILYILT
jgi:hypothetical protein